MKVGGELTAIGSLDYFNKDEIRDMWDRPAGISAGDEDENTEMSVYIPDESVDWVLMNPPYSRTNGKYGAFQITGLSDEERDACQKKWESIIRKESAKKRAGMAASFLALARNKVKPGGKIGFVLPMTASFAESWAVTRRMIERDFTDIIAIAVTQGEALGKEALSADTAMGEMILVATRRMESEPDKHEPIKCVTLHDPFSRNGEAGELARAISYAADMARNSKSSRPVKVGNDEVGLINVFDAGGEGAPWSPLGATHVDLVLAAVALTHGRIEFLGKSMNLDAGMTTLGKVFGAGQSHTHIGHFPDGHGRGAFELHEVQGEADEVGEDKLLWEANCTEQNRLVIAPTHKGYPVSGRDQQCSRMRAYSANLFYSQGMRWNSQCLLAATTKHKTMGGRAWAALTHDDIRVCKAFALWVNSTLGMMVHWTRGQRTHSGRGATAIGAIKQMPCPKLNEIGDSVLDFATAEFDRLTSRQLRPAYQAHLDETRWEIDQAVVKMLGLPDDAIEVINELRPLWCRERTVRSDKPFVSLEEWEAKQS